MKLFFIRLLSVFLCFAVCRCSPKDSRRDVLLVALESEPETLDPRKAADANGMRLVSLIFSGLVKTTGAEVLPDGAKRWERDGLSYTFYMKPLWLRPPAPAGKGGPRAAPPPLLPKSRPVTKEDIQFSFGEFMKKSSPFFSAFQNIKSVRAEGEPSAIKVKISLKKPSAVFLAADLPVIKILPKKEIQQRERDFLRAPFGSGPFRLAKKNSREILLERVSDGGGAPAGGNQGRAAGKNPGKEGEKAAAPKTKYLSFQIVRDSFTRVQKLLAGQLDIAPAGAIPAEKLARFEPEKFKIISRPGLSSAYLLLNLRRPPLDNKKIREALAQAINREEIIKHKLKGHGEAAASLIPPALAFQGVSFLNRRLKFPAFSPEAARRAIQSLGLEGAPLALTVSNSRGSVDRGRVLASQMSRAGLKVSVQSYEWGAFYRDISRGRYDMALMKWVGISDPDIYRVAFHSENHAPQGRNRSFYSRRAADILLSRGAREMDPKKRKKIYDRIQEMILSDMAVIPLWHDREITVLKNSVQNYSPLPNGAFYPLAAAFKTNRGL